MRQRNIQKYFTPHLFFFSPLLDASEQMASISKQYPLVMAKRQRLIQNHRILQYVHFCFPVIWAIPVYEITFRVQNNVME